MQGDIILILQTGNKAQGQSFQYHIGNPELEHKSPKDACCPLDHKAPPYQHILETI